MPWDPNRPIPADELPSSRGDEDPLSPTTIVLNYLRSKGMQPNAQNVRAAVLANARMPNQAGPDPVGYVDTAGREINLRNEGPEDTARSGGSGGRAAPRRGPAGPVDKHDDPQTSAQPAPMEVPPVPPRFMGTMEPGAKLDTTLPPPTEGARAGEGPPPQLPPPPSGAEVTAPTDPLSTAITRAIAGPEPLPALPAPTAPAPAQLPAPPEVRALPAPSPQLALPAPPEAPPVLPAPTPRITIEDLTRGAPAPGRQVQGYPIESTPMTRALPGAASGAVKGAQRGGVPGAVAGAITGALPELGPYIAKNLHLW